MHDMRVLGERGRAAFNRRAFAAAMLALAYTFATPVGALAAEAAGRVEEAKGRSTGLLEGSIRTLKRDADVFLQELVQTGASARLALALGINTRVQLGERTRLKIEKKIVEHGGTVLLERGALLFDSGESSDAGGFVVRTPFAIVAARGTRFFVGPSKGVIGVFCERGSVSVRNRGGRVVLRPGEGTDLTSPDVPPTPPAAWGAPRIEAAIASVS
jgi:ferric-dicitrate binding protein FerR (iron transport regulator)